MTEALWNSLTQLGAGGLVAVLIVREVGRWPFLKNRLKGQEREQPAQPSPEFWKAEMRHAVLEALGPSMTMQTAILSEMKDTNAHLLTQMTKMTSGIEELVDMSRRDRTSVKHL